MHGGLEIYNKCIFFILLAFPIESLVPFDFYLPEHNLCIEFDGRQHFEVIDFYGGQKSFDSTKRNDQIKNDYCKKNGVKLFRIKFDSNIKNELNKIIS